MAILRLDKGDGRVVAPSWVQPFDTKTVASGEKTKSGGERERRVVLKSLCGN